MQGLIIKNYYSWFYGPGQTGRWYNNPKSVFFKFISSSSFEESSHNSHCDLQTPLISSWGDWFYVKIYIFGPDCLTQFVFLIRGRSTIAFALKHPFIVSVVYESKTQSFTFLYCIYIHSGSEKVSSCSSWHSSNYLLTIPFSTFYG